MRKDNRDNLHFVGVKLHVFSSRHKLLVDVPRITDFCRAEYGELHLKKETASWPSGQGL